MKNLGRSLEKTISLIQDALKNSIDTVILQNYKAVNKSGRKREIDIMLITKINNIEIKIAIECKDFKSKIPVEKIEAFESKCNRIEEIYKKVFVGSNGFQIDAINAAKEFNIELFTANEITEEIISNWFSIKKLQLNILPNFIAPIMYMDAEEEDLKNLIHEFDKIVHFENLDKPVHINKLLLESIEVNKKRLWGIAIFKWMKLDDQNKFEPFPVQFRITFNNSYILTAGDKQTKLLGLDSSVYVKFIEMDVKILGGRSFKDINGRIKANSIKVQIGTNSTGEMIINSKNEESIYFTDELGKTIKLHTICTFNPESKKNN